MLNLQPDLLSDITTRAIQSAQSDQRWVRAILRGSQELAENPYVEAIDDHTLLIGSESGEVYVSNGQCQCTAFKFGKPCVHRAAARLYFRYVEAEAKQEAARKAADLINELF